MLINVSLIPGRFYLLVNKRKVDEICQHVHRTLSQSNKIEIIIETPQGKEILRRIYPDPIVQNESVEAFCKRIRREMKKII